MNNKQNKLKNRILTQNQEQIYGDEQFQSVNGYYVSMVDKDFQIDFNNLSYQQIQQSATKMRNMMKKLSKVLDDKIHKYYGLMGVKHKLQQKSQDKLIKQLEKERYALNKLIISQEKQIKLIEQLDKQMASNKRIQKQADRLRQYFETKKAMIQAEKQTKFSQGQVNKLGQYLARDLDVEKQYFKFNNIKQNLQYAILKDQQLMKKQRNLQDKFIEYHQKIQEINSNYNILLMEAKDKKLILSDNKQIYQNFMKKKILFEKKKQIKATIQILKNSTQSSFYALAIDIQNLIFLKNQKQQKLSRTQSQINLLANKINYKIGNINQQKINKKIQLSMSIKNIDTLLKSKRQKSAEIIQINQSKVFSSSFDLTQSKLSSRPNFKIKQILGQNRNNSKNILGKSLDLRQINKKVNLNQNNQKRIIKWRRDQKKSEYEIPVNTNKNIQIERHKQQNPQQINFSLNEDTQIHIQ